MTKYTGKGVYGAVAMGKISVFKKQDTAINVFTQKTAREKRKELPRPSRRQQNSSRAFMTRHSGRWAKQTLRSLRYT